MEETFLIDVPIPSMGATVSELTVIDIKVSAGARISKGDKIAELESDKSVFEFEAPCDGVIAAVQARAGDILPSGAPFLRIETADISLKNLAVKDAPKPAAAVPAPAPVAVPVAAVAVAKPATGLQWTPRAAKLAQDAGLDPATLVGIAATGPGGRVSGDDIAAYLAAHPKTAGSGLSALSAQRSASAPAAGTETVCIAGVGYAVPKNIRPTSEILKAFPGRTEAEMHKLTGIHERRYADADESATSLAAKAVNHALAQAGMSASHTSSS